MHIQKSGYFSQQVNDDIDGILTDMKKTHADLSGSASETSVAVDRWKALDEAANFKGSRLERLLMLFCKQIGLKYSRLTAKKQWLIRIARKSDFAKS